ncbi:MAG: DUF5131 family protein, partial [Planctomycetes bacterium]|nr:DUF5131 family protein [Planctomycetota bacterium]
IAMAEASKIEWTDHTFNPWVGCSKVHAGCTHCYAETLIATRYKRAVWGPNGTRVLTTRSNWAKPCRWNEMAKAGICPKCSGKTFVKVKQDRIPCDRCNQAGNIGPYRAKVFCASLADVFEDWQGPIVASDAVSLWQCPECDVIRSGALPEVQKVPVHCYLHGACRPLTMDGVRRRLFAMIDDTPYLDWLLLTKRPEKIRRMWPEYAIVPNGDPVFTRRDNVWLGTSISDQASADKQIPELVECRELSPVVFLSVEPLLGPIDLDFACAKRDISCIDWVIIGGESGHGARPYNVDHAWDLLRQCDSAEVPAFHKQLGAFPVTTNINQYEFEGDVAGWGDCAASARFGLQHSKGADMSEWPRPFDQDGLKVRQFPVVS